MSAERLSIATLAAAMTLTGATQLRVSGLPIGPGELLLLAWCGATIGRAATRRDMRIRRHALPLLIFWCVSLTILFIDLIVYHAIGGRQTVSYHALVAYAFCALGSLAYAVWATAPRLSLLTQWLILATVVPLTVIRVAAAIGLPLGPIDPWYSIRFRGWSDNPNQIAFQLAAVPFLALYCRRHAGGARARRFASVLVPLSLIVGASVFSDALTVAWAGGATCFVLTDYVSERRRARGSGWMTFGRFVVLPLAVLVVVLLGGAEIYDHLRSEALTVYEDGSQGSVRMALWNHGLDAMLTAPVLGLGPGSHSGVIAAFAGSESHNSFIDWASNAGFVGLFAYLVLLVAIVRPVIRSGEAPLIAALVALIAMSSFHYTFRHPSFWLSLVLIAGLASRHAAPARRRSV